MKIKEAELKVKQMIEQTDYMIYCSIQIVLFTKIKWKKKIEDKVNQIVSFYQRDLEKEKLTSLLKVLGETINDHLSVPFQFA